MNKLYYLALILLLSACGIDNEDTTTAVNSATAGATFSVSGQINSASLIVSDTDVNDNSAQDNDANDDFNQAQSIDNFSTVYGFVNREFSATYGVSGRFSTSIDRRDFYRVNLKKGQVIQLHIANYNGFQGFPNIGNKLFDLDLILHNATKTMVGFTDGFDEFEKITVPSDGSYYIEVLAQNGLSKYTLSLLEVSGSNNHQQSMDFVSNQSIVQYHTTNTINPDIQSQIQLKKTTIISRSERIKQAKNSSKFLGELAELNLESYDKYMTLQQIKQDRQRPGVVNAQPNYIYRPMLVPNDTYYPKQWHYPAINLEQAWDISTGFNASRDTIVAVVDTGVFLNHPDLADKLVAGYDFISDISNAGDGDGIDADPDDVGDGSLLGNSSWHGTHVAGIIGAKSNNNFGVAGVSWGAKIMPIRVLGKNGFGTSYDVMQGVLYAAGLKNDSGTIPNQKADIINLSLGGDKFSQIDQNFYTQVRNAGVIVIAAAGNESTSQLFYPASYEGVVSVSAVDYARNKAGYSNFGSKIDIAAPGGDLSANLNGDGFSDGILSTLVNATSGSRVGNYAFYQGTSMAAPHVAGVAALMKAQHPTLTPQDFDDLLAGGKLTNEGGQKTTPADSVRDNIFGYGVIDAFKSLREARLLSQGGVITPTPAKVVLSPQLLNLGFAKTSIVSIQNTGQLPATITSATSTQPWLSIAEQVVDVQKFGLYKISVNTDGLADGNYSGHLTFGYQTSNQNSTISATINISAGSVSVNGSIRSLHAILVNKGTTEVVKTAVLIKVSEGVYDYKFSGVPAGEYSVLAGSDLDNDNFLCQTGETCGGYPVANSLIAVSVKDKNIAGIDFVVNILSSALNSANLDTQNSKSKTGIKLTKPN